jgi:hypothetical protein
MQALSPPAPALLLLLPLPLPLQLRLRLLVLRSHPERSEGPLYFVFAFTIAYSSPSSTVEQGIQKHLVKRATNNEHNQTHLMDFFAVELLLFCKSRSTENF